MYINTITINIKIVIKIDKIELKTPKNIYDQVKFGMFCYWYLCIILCFVTFIDMCMQI